MAKREVWIDNVKVLACVLVVLGHFFQSMVQAGILPGNDLYGWFNQTIYFFHVELFLLCSGYLYQKFSRVDTFSAWGKNIAKKGLALGIPYLFFSTVTWVLKTLFSGSVNMELGGFFETLFLTPTAPYWYLYCLFFLFLITPTFQNKKTAAIGLSAAVLLKVFSIVWTGSMLYAVRTVCENMIWFVAGMFLALCSAKRDAALDTPKSIVAGFGSLPAGIALWILFFAASVIVWVKSISFPGIDFLMGAVACAALVLIVSYLCQNDRQTPLLRFLSAYTMPIFLMHTIFAAPVRIILIKIGVTGVAIHLILGITISFAGPIIAAMILRKIKYMDFLLYPTKYIKIK